MDNTKLLSLVNFSQTLAKSNDWRAALNASIKNLRELLVFDNFAIFHQGERGTSPEVLYARAIGREKNAEADATWGDMMAVKVLKNGQSQLQEPVNEAISDNNRLDFPYLLGHPLITSQGLFGAIIFIRFGGPSFTNHERNLVNVLSALISSLFERHDQQIKLKRLETLQRQLRLQEDFVATVSHDLRTPLGFIKGYTTTLLREDTKWDDNTRREFLTIIDEETDHLANLLENVLESARLQSETISMNFQPLRLESMLRDSALRAQSRDKNLQISLKVESLPPILADNVRLSQVVDNLLSNAQKYAPGSPVQIKLEQSGQFAHIIISDQGPGISDEHLPYIFDRFYRVPDQDGKTGSGLGLFICKQIILAHHGNIRAESVPGRGTDFFIQLPL